MGGVLRVLAAAAVAVSLGSLAGCQVDQGPGGAGTPGPDPETDNTARRIDGPLSVGEVVGGQSLLRPKGDPQQWWASVGSFVLCTSGAPATLEGVRLAGTKHPLDAEPWLVSQTPVDAAYSTFGSVTGSPPEFDEPYARASDTLEGTYTADFAGTSIDDACPAGDTKSGYTEVVLALKTGPSGIKVPHWWLDYSVGDENFTLRVDWTVVMCGDVVQERCSPI